MEKGLFKISPAPYVRKGNSVNKIILDFIIGLMPAVFAGIYFYGVDAVKVIVVAVLSSVLAEGLWNKFVKKKSFLDNFSPILNGLILALILPTYLPIWIIVVGSIFGSIVVKQFFGGYGQNFMEPASATKAFLIASWAAIMAKPVVDANAGASEVVETITLMDKFIGQPSGNIGEVSILAIAIGGIYLLLRGRINLRAPLAFIIMATGFCMYFEKPMLLPGAFYFVAVFLATDYATTPMTKWGQVIFGALAGILAGAIAIIVYNPEGPYYAIIIMNLGSPCIEYLTTKTYRLEGVK
ncbi:MAG: RnfABCDGE type electron transport complex subunit D [Clostridium sp.]|uniref:RnfABCDGE type electron transport complex subunit D n=1 Tax=Clostridium sp. TaxID=1506 RepID=UPI003EE54112